MTAPSGPVFVDTNVLVYAHDVTEREKQPMAEQLLAELWRSGDGVLSTQVLQEFYSISTRKIAEPLTPSFARQIVAEYSEWCAVNTDPLLIIAASHLAEKHTLNFWDGLILEAALRCAAAKLVSEDLQDGRRFGQLAVRNPFGAAGS